MARPVERAVAGEVPSPKLVLRVVDRDCQPAMRQVVAVAADSFCSPERQRVRVAPLRGSRDDDRVRRKPGPRPAGALQPLRRQYSFLKVKYEPRMVPASLDFCLANLNDASSAGTSIPSLSLNPTARFVGPSTVYNTLTERPLS